MIKLPNILDEITRILKNYKEKSFFTKDVFELIEKDDTNNDCF